MSKESTGAWTKIVIEYGPLIAFFIANANWDIYVATATIMVTMPLALLASRLILGHISRMLWISGILLIVFGSLTLYLQDDRFIKMKPTVLFALFGIILVVGQRMNKPVLKYLFEPAFPPMQDRGWALLTQNWGLLFLAKAAVNEYVWRHYSTDVWVNVKVFGFTIASMIFLFAQFYYLLPYMDLKGQDDNRRDQD